MNNKLTTLALALTVAWSATGAVPAMDFDGRRDHSTGFQPALTGIAVPAAPAAEPTASAQVKEWTVMVFINGKNDLELAGLRNVNQMEEIGSTADINIVAEIGRMNGQAAGDTDADGDWTGVRRIFVTRDDDNKAINSPVLQEDKTADMGDYRRAADFVLWAKQHFPAKKYALVIWNHGAGWMDPKTLQKGISFDNETGNYIRTAQIGLLLQAAGKVDLLAFDACMMSMAEVAYEVKDYAGVIVGSEEAVPNQGFPYNLFLGKIADNPRMGSEEAGTELVRAFKQFYQSTGAGAQLAAIRAGKMKGLADRLAEFARSARETGDIEALRAARAGVIRYSVVNVKEDPAMRVGFYGDISQFAGLVSANLKSGPGSAALSAGAKALQDYISSELVIHNEATGNNRIGRSLAESGGIAVYLPPAETRIRQERIEGLFEGKYQDFSFNKATGWYDFVTFLYNTK